MSLPSHPVPDGRADLGERVVSISSLNVSPVSSRLAASRAQIRAQILASDLRFTSLIAGGPTAGRFGAWRLEAGECSSGCLSLILSL